MALDPDLIRRLELALALVAIGPIRAGWPGALAGAKKRWLRSATGSLWRVEDALQRHRIPGSGSDRLFFAPGMPAPTETQGDAATADRGNAMTDDDYPDALPSGYRLHWYVLERVLGQGGFGITYLARDSNLDRLVAIKEYLPTEAARRRSDASAQPRTESHSERFAWGLERFLAEARTLARFDHPNIVRVLSVFEANNTAYMVMRFEEGQDLGTLLERRGTVSERELVECLLPVLEGLQLVHSSGFIHRDIKPENIYVRDDGSPVLLDFGSARQSFGSAKTMTILVAPGYAPLEQYYGDARTQGPWTDIYGLGATCYRAVAGKAPLDAIARAKGVLGSTRDLLDRAADVGRGRYSDGLLRAIDHALELSERDRPQSIADWRNEIAAALAPAPARVVVQPASRESSKESARTTMPLATPATPRPDEITRNAPAGPPLAAAAVRSHARAGLAIAGVGVVVALALLLGLRPDSVATDTRPGASPPAPRVAPLATPSVAAAAPPTVAPSSSAQQRASVREPATEIVLSPPAVTPARSPAREQGSRGDSSLSRQTALPDRPAAARPSTQVKTSDGGPLPASAINATAGAGVPVPGPAAAAAPAPAPLSATLAPTLAAAGAAGDTSSPARRVHDDTLDSAEAALRRGDGAAAAQIAAPLAAAGVARAQTLLGRAQEARSREQKNDFEAYVWYGIAARAGDAGAQPLRDKVAQRLQPAEIRQADQIIERWKPRTEPTAERGAP